MPSVIGPADRPWRNLDPEAAPPAEIDIHLRHLRHLRIIFSFLVRTKPPSRAPTPFAELKKDKYPQMTQMTQIRRKMPRHS
jgi:hypothetical protein